MKFVTKQIPFREVDGIFKYVVEVRCDTLSDVTPPDKEWHIGSVATVINEDAVYMLNSSGNWVKHNSSSADTYTRDELDEKLAKITSGGADVATEKDVTDMLEGIFGQ